MSKVAVLTIAHGRHEHLRQQRRVLEQVAPEVEHVVVAMGDPGIAAVVEASQEGSVTVLDLPTTPEGLPLARARNLAAEHALRSGADLLVFLDVDCVPGRGLLAHYERAAQQAPSSLLCGPVTYLGEGVVVPDDPAGLAGLTDHHPARPSPQPGVILHSSEHHLFWSLSFAATARTWSEVGGFCEDYVGYGGEDTDFAWVARRRGIDLVWVGGAEAYHQYHPVTRPPVEHLDAIVRNARLFHQRWGQWPMQGWLQAFVERGLIIWSAHEISRCAPSG